jgi:hypothetical protein
MQFQMPVYVPFGRVCIRTLTVSSGKATTKPTTPPKLPAAKCFHAAGFLAGAATAAHRVLLTDTTEEAEQTNANASAKQNNRRYTVANGTFLLKNTNATQRTRHNTYAPDRCAQSARESES